MLLTLQILVLGLLLTPLPAVAAQLDDPGGQTGPGDYEFLCQDGGQGLSIVDVLRASGEHGTFLSLLAQHDDEGLEVLASPELADKTVWAPTDRAFEEAAGTLASLSGEEVNTILGYHITPPRRTPEGPYPIITPRFLADGGEMVHQTRTGILTGSDQRVRTRSEGNVLTVEESRILPISWCTQTGSAFSIDTVIMDVSAPSLAERAVYTVFYQYPFVTLLAVGAATAGVILYVRKRLRAGGSAT